MQDFIASFDSIEELRDRLPQMLRREIPLDQIQVLGLTTAHEGASTHEIDWLQVLDTHHDRVINIIFHGANELTYEGLEVVNRLLAHDEDFKIVDRSNHKSDSSEIRIFPTVNGRSKEAT